MKMVDVRLVLRGYTLWTGAIHGSEGWRLGECGWDVLVDYYLFLQYAAGGSEISTIEIYQPLLV